MNELFSVKKSTGRPRLVLLTQWFDPEPTFKGIVFARALQERGFEVEVVTGFPNYPGGHLYDGYKIGLVKREVIDSISITRLPLYPSHNRNPFGRVANYVSFFMSATCYLTFFARSADVMYVYHPPLTVGLAAAVAKFFRRTPIVIDIQDMWPDTLRATGMINNGKLLGLVGVACNWLYRSANHIVVLSPGFKKLLKQRGVPANKVSVIYNWADEVSLACRQNANPFQNEAKVKFRLLFAGNMGRAQALWSVLEAAAIVQRKRQDIEFCFLGDGLNVAELKRQAADMDLKNVNFLRQVPMHEVSPYLEHSDCLLVHLRHDRLFGITIPSKTQAYMAAGKPIIMAVSGDAADLVKKADCGLCVNPEAPHELAEAILKMASHPRAKLEILGKRARNFYQSTLSLSKGVEAFTEVFRAQITRKDRLL